MGGGGGGSYVVILNEALYNCFKVLFTISQE